MSPQVAIIILNWNGLQDTEACLASLQQTTYANYSIIIVDNGSAKDEAGELEQKYGKKIKVLRSGKNLGFAAGCNLAIEQTIKKDYQYILLLNNDIKVAPDFLNILVNTAEKDKSIGIVGPQIYFYNEPQKTAFAGGKINFFTGEAKHLHLKQETTEVNFIEGSSMLISMATIKKIGMLDPQYFSYWEDADFCVRAKLNKTKIIFAPQAKIWHKVSASSGGDQSPFSIYYLARNRWIFMKKFAKFYHWFFFIPFYFLDSLRYFLIFKKIDKIKAYYLGWRDGVFIRLQK